MTITLLFISFLLYLFFILIKNYTSYFKYVNYLILFISFILFFTKYVILLYLFIFILILVHSYFGICEIINDYIHNNLIVFILKNYILHIICLSTIISYITIIPDFIKYLN